MKQNGVSDALHTIGVLVIVIGLIASFILGVASSGILLLVVGGISSFIVGICFIGLSEIIALLQQSVDTQEKILRKLEDGTKENGPSKTVIQDIEDHLPDM